MHFSPMIPRNARRALHELESFRPLAQQPIQGMNITVRTTRAPESLIEPMRKMTAELMPVSPLNRTRTPRALVDQGSFSHGLTGLCHSHERQCRPAPLKPA
jgi:hypothetical protein